MRRPTLLLPTAVLGLVLPWAMVHVFGREVPWGASREPWTKARVEGPTLVSPDGRVRLRVHFNDAGALHSGNHWTWVVEDSLIWGQVVVAEGYLSAGVAVSGEPVPITWTDDGGFAIRFESGRYD